MILNVQLHRTKLSLHVIGGCTNRLWTTVAHHWLEPIVFSSSWMQHCVLMKGALIAAWIMMELYPGVEIIVWVNCEDLIVNFLSTAMSSLPRVAVHFGCDSGLCYWWLLLSWLHWNDCNTVDRWLITGVADWLLITGVAPLVIDHQCSRLISKIVINVIDV